MTQLRSKLNDLRKSNGHEHLLSCYIYILVFESSSYHYDACVVTKHPPVSIYSTKPVGIFWMFLA